MKNKSSSRLWWLVLPSLWVGHNSAVAQESNAAPADIYQGPLPYNFSSQPTGPTSPSSSQAGTPYMGTSSLAGSLFGLGDYLTQGPALAAWGPFRLYPQLSYSFTYGNGLQAQPGLNSTTAINTFGADALIRIGDRWSLDYSPSESIYSDPLFRNTFNQSVTLKGVTTYEDWTLNFSQSYIDSTYPLVETGTQLEQVAYVTAFNAAWQMNGHMSLQLGLNQNFRFAQELNALHEWTESDWLNYQFTRQVGLAAGVTGGYDEVSIGSDMPFEQGQIRLNFQPRKKLVLSVTGGVEDRQFIHPSAPALVSPIFNATAQYQVLAGTALTLSGSRTVVPSFYGNEINVTTSVSAGVRQQIAEHVYLTADFSYAVEPYTSVVAGQLPQYFLGTPPTTSEVETRNDNRTNFRISLSTTIRAHLTASIFYLRSENDSSQFNYSYSGNQGGLQLNYRF
jgi:hypothetical protein